MPVWRASVEQLTTHGVHNQVMMLQKDDASLRNLRSANRKIQVIEVPVTERFGFFSS